MSDKGLTGRCLCGEVEVHATQAEEQVGVCHCDMCRKWSGGPFYSAHCGVAVTFKGEDAITRFSSSPWADRGFCHRCGTHLFYLYKESGEYFVPAGLFDGDNFSMGTEIFVDEKGPYYELHPTSRKMTGAEVMAAFQQGGDNEK